MKPEVRTSVTSSFRDLVPLLMRTACGKTYFSSFANCLSFDVGFLAVVIMILGS